MSLPPIDADNEDFAIEPGDSVESEDPAEPADPESDPVGRVRGVLAAILGVAAILALMVTAIAVWAKATVFDSEKFADIVGAAIEQPDVQAALATYVTDQVFAAVDVETALTDGLPDELKRFAPAIAAGARTATFEAVTRLLANPDVQDTITGVVERAHGRAMQLIEGDGLVDGITVVDGEVTINLLPLVSRGLNRVQELGLFAQLDVPVLTADGDPVDQIAQLESATGRDLPDDFGQLVVYRSDRLADAQASLQTAQNTLAFAKRALWALIALTILIGAASVLVARNRWRAALWLGLGGVVGMVITRMAVRRVVDEAPNVADKAGGRSAISAIVGEASTGLLRLMGLLLFIAAAVAGIALLRRHWRRADLVLVGAVLTFVVIVGVLGITITSLILGLVIALLVPVVVGRVVA